MLNMLSGLYVQLLKIEDDDRILLCTLLIQTSIEEENFYNSRKSDSMLTILEPNCHCILPMFHFQLDFYYWSAFKLRSIF